jgi:hypothetical protein
VAPSVADRRLGLQPVATQRGVDGGPLGRLSGGRGGRGGGAHWRIERWAESGIKSQQSRSVGTEEAKWQSSTRPRAGFKGA